MSLPPAPPGYEHRMPRCAEATSLRAVGVDVFGREVRLTPPAAEAWLAMRQAAEDAGLQLLLVSAFRSIERQTEIVRRKLESGMSLEDILKTSAYPGHSEHHTGRAVDLGSPACAHLTELFAHTPEFAWLDAHAARFGFALSYPRANTRGIAFEPWHWCLHPPPPSASPSHLVAAAR